MVWEEFTTYRHFIVYEFEAILAPLDEHRKSDICLQTCNHERYYLWYIGQSACLFSHEDRERLIEQIIDDLTEKQEVLFAYVLKRHQYTSHYQMLSRELKKTMKVMG